MYILNRLPEKDKIEGLDHIKAIRSSYYSIASNARHFRRDATTFLLKNFETHTWDEETDLAFAMIENQVLVDFEMEDDYCDMYPLKEPWGAYTTGYHAMLVVEQCEACVEDGNIVGVVDYVLVCRADGKTVGGHHGWFSAEYWTQDELNRFLQQRADGYEKELTEDWPVTIINNMMVL